MWFAVSCSVITIICWTWQYQSAARVPFCLFVVTWKEIFSSSTEMQHLLKVYTALSFIFLTLLIYLLALTWPDAPWKYLLDSSLSFTGYSPSKWFLKMGLFLWRSGVCATFFFFWWHNDSFAPRCLVCSHSLCAQWQQWAGLLLLLITIKAAFLAVMGMNLSEQQRGQASRDSYQWSTCSFN